MYRRRRARLQVDSLWPVHFGREAAGEVEAYFFVVPVTGRAREQGQRLRALLHKELGHGPVHFTLLDIVGEVKTVDYLMGTGLQYCQRDCLGRAAAAHGAINAAGFGVKIVPVIHFSASPPSAAAEGFEAVTTKAVDIDFASGAVEADGFVAWG